MHTDAHSPAFLEREAPPSDDDRCHAGPDLDDRTDDERYCDVDVDGAL